MSVQPDRPTTRPPLWRELVAGLAVFGVYIVVAAEGGPGRRQAADHNAEILMGLERLLHIDVELPLNEWLARHPVLTVLANYEYAYTYVISAFALLIWLYARHPGDYRQARSSFIVLNLLAIACFWIFPVTPPRLLDGLGYVDTVATNTTFGSWGTPLVSSANQLAAMPSLHLAWALWVSVVLARLSRGLLVQLISAVHVAVTVYVIVATANHFLIDAIAAAPLVWVSVALVGRHRSRPQRIAAADAFFLHVETDAAPQHVGGMVVLAESAHGGPSLEEIRALLREELPAMPRARQRPARSSSWRRWRWVGVDESELDWDWHVCERRAGHAGGDESGAAAVLSRVTAALAAERLPRDRPMWRVVLVREISPGRSGLLFLMHHCVADGIGTVVHALNLLRPRFELPAGDRAAPGVLRTAAATAIGLAQLATDGRPAARLGPGSAARGFATTELDLQMVRSVAHHAGTRVTDLVMCLLASAIVGTHPDFARSAGGRLRVSVPIMLREPGAAAEGNITAGVITDLPLGVMAPADRLADIGRRNVRLGSPTRALASRFVMSSVLSVLPPPAQRWCARTVYGPAFVQGIVSNIPGPTVPMTLAGVPLEHVVPILPLAPGAPLALGALSWNGALGIGLAVDAECLDADRLVSAMGDALADLTAPGAAPVSGGGSGRTRPAGC